MESLGRSAVLALQLVADRNPEVINAVGTSLSVSLTATVIACLVGAPFGVLLAIRSFPGRRALLIVVNAMLGLPPVVVGLAAYLALSRAGPLGELGLLFTKTAMIVAQVMLTLPIAVAFAGPALLSPRPPTEAPIAGIELPSGAVLFPVGHHATLTVAIPHDGRPAGSLGALWPSAEQVTRGWLAVVERAGRLELPDESHVADVVHARCELLLEGPDLPDDDPVGFLLGADLIVRMSGDAEHWVPEVADAVQRTLRMPTEWDVRAALDAAARVLAAAGERRALQDLARHRRGDAVAATAASLPDTAPDGVRGLAWAERRLVASGELFPAGIPPAWWGQQFEVHALPAGPASTISFAIRWHGARPAILWETTGEQVTLTAPSIAPAWSTSDRSGEALWPAPIDADAVLAASSASASPTSSLDVSSDTVSFS